MTDPDARAVLRRKPDAEATVSCAVSGFLAFTSNSEVPADKLNY